MFLNARKCRAVISIISSSMLSTIRKCLFQNLPSLSCNVCPQLTQQAEKLISNGARIKTWLYAPKKTRIPVLKHSGLQHGYPRYAERICFCLGELIHLQQQPNKTGFLSWNIPVLKWKLLQIRIPVLKYSHPSAELQHDVCTKDILATWCVYQGYPRFSDTIMQLSHLQNEAKKPVTTPGRLLIGLWSERS